MIKKSTAWIAAPAAVVSMTGALVLATSTSATAYDYKPYPTCGAGGFCVWESHDGNGVGRFRTEGNAAWPSGAVNDDRAWRNNGYYVPGADHVRVYDASTRPDSLTLCIHRGHQGQWTKNDTTIDAAFEGNYHRWGGECRTGEPQL